MRRKIGKMRKNHDNTLSLIVDNSLKNDNASHYPDEIGNLIYKLEELPKIKTYVRNDDYKIFYKQSHLPDSEMGYNINKGNFLLTIKKGLESIKNDLSIIKELVSSHILQASPDKEDENFMYEIKEVLEKLNDTNNRIGKIETTLAVIEERTKKLDNLPTKSEMQNLIYEALKSKPDEDKVKVLIDEAFSSKKIATETMVENQVIKSRNAIIISMITIIGIATGIIIKLV
jgi:hypothetical protein